MKKSVYVILLVNLFIELSTLMAYEGPEYLVIDSNGDIEIRRYQSYIVAETLVECDFEEAGSEAFQVLFDYISGANLKKESIEMTSPVSQEEVKEEGEKIEMTAPVNQELLEMGKYRVSFVMPSRYTFESLPEPRDNRITIRKIPAKKIIVIRYSGTWSADNYKENEARLWKYIKENNYITIGEPNWARYDAPFVPWFMRRNEIMIELQ